MMDKYYNERLYSIECTVEDMVIIKGKIEKQNGNEDYIIINITFNPIKGTAKMKDRVRLEPIKELIMNYKMDMRLN